MGGTKDTYPLEAYSAIQNSAKSTKSRHFHIQNLKIFWGGSTVLSLDPFALSRNGEESKNLVL